MAKIFETSFETGSYREKVSNVFGTPTASPFRRTEKGNAILSDGASSIINYIDGSTLAANSVSFSFRTISQARQGIFGGILGPYMTYISGGIIGTYDANVNNATNRTVFADGHWHHVIINRTDANDFSFYVDGVEEVRRNDSDWRTSNHVVVASSGLGLVSNLPFDGNIGEIVVYDHILTAKERSDAYERFLKASPRGIELYPKPVLPEYKIKDMSRYVDTGLCLSYNCIPSAGARLVDTSNQNATGAIYGASEILEGLSFDGKDDYVAPNLSIALAATIKTICFRIKLASTTEMILDGDNTGSLIIDTNAGILQYPAYDNAFIDGVDIDTIFADQWTDIVITSSTPVDNNTPTLGRTTAAAFTYGKFEIADLQYWSNQWTLADAKKYHNSFVKPVLGRIPSVYDAVGATWPFGMVQGTGSYVVDEIAINSSNIIIGGGTFLTDETANWTPTNGTFTYDAVNLWGVFTSTATGALNRMFQNPGAVVGNRYRFKAEIKSPNVSGRGVWKLATAAGVFTDVFKTNRNPDLTTDWQWYEFETIQAVNMSVAFCDTTSSVTGDIYHIRNISLLAIPALPELDSGAKFLRCTGAGLTSVSTKQAYGTWEGMIYKGDTANRLYMILIANKIGVAGYVQGYALNFDNDEGIYLEKYDGVGGTSVLFATAVSYITINTWYKYRFKKTLDGVMTLLLKGGALVPTAGYDGWTLATPTGAYTNPTAADNTYTTCEYSVINGGVLDRFILDHTDNGVKQ